ncbi:hypothetical protein ACP275_08G242100 [Erythranthe tilingii]
MGDVSHDKRSGCGIFNVVFGRRSIWPRRSTSTGSLPSSSNPNHVTRYPSTPVSRAPKNDAVSNPPQKSADRIVSRPPQNISKSPPPFHNHNHNQGAHKINQPNNNHAKNQQGYNGHSRKVPPAGLGISGELESMITDHQKSRGAAAGLVRASSSNVMIYGNLGNLRQNNSNSNSNNPETNGIINPTGSTNGIINPPTSSTNNGRYSNKKINGPTKPVSLCRALSTRIDPEQLKILGNEDYKNGRFAEALALYEAAISIDPNKASYRSNKSAALVALGKLLEAAFECREAIRIDPFYQRAHNRLATIYVRLGEAEKAMYHFKQSGPEADPDASNKAKKVTIHLNKCTDAMRQRDWITILKESSLSIESGADSAPLIFGLKAEALLKLNRHQEAIETMDTCPNFDVDECTKFFGPIGSSSLLIYRAQIDLVAGRFDDAMSAAQRASKLDPNGKEVKSVLRRTRALSTARSNGNELFKVARYSEACIAYGEGLSHDPYNAVLLCNRAACRSKLGQYEKAIEDCTSALNVRSAYSKARLRRADCYSKIGKWGECIKDCEVLIRENPDDEEIERIFKEAKENLGQHNRSLDIVDTSVVVVSSDEHFRDCVTSSRGTSVVLFCNKKTGDRTIMQHMEKLNKRFPSVNFLKVEVEDHPLLAKSERLKSLPGFIIYTNGSRAKEVPGDNYELLESSIKYLSVHDQVKKMEDFVN